MIEVTEPQVWTLIGVFGTATFGMVGLVSGLFVRVVRSEIGSVRSELLGEIRSVRSELLGEVRSLSTKVDHLDRDVQLLMDREFGGDRG